MANLICLEEDSYFIYLLQCMTDMNIRNHTLSLYYTTDRLKTVVHPVWKQIN